MATNNSVPLGSAGFGVNTNDPSAARCTSPETSFPAASRTTNTSSAANPDPTTEPAGPAATVKASGATESTITDTGVETFPARSRAATNNSVPLGSAGFGVNTNDPSAARCTSPGTSFPAASRTTNTSSAAKPDPTTEPAGPAATVRASGATASITSAVPCETFPAASRAVTFSTTPSPSVGFNATAKDPSGFAVVCATMFWAASRIITVDPGSACPETDVPFDGATCGAFGATASTLIEADVSLNVPLFTANTFRTTPSVSGTVGVNVNAPVTGSTTVVPGTTVPAAVRTSTESPELLGRTVPVTDVAPAVFAVGGASNTSTDWLLTACTEESEFTTVAEPPENTVPGWAPAGIL